MSKSLDTAAKIDILKARHLTNRDILDLMHLTGWDLDAVLEMSS